MAIDYAGAEEFILNKLKAELPRDLHYHGIHHTLDVYQAAVRIAESENVSPDELNLLKIAALFHDAGFVKRYQHHEEAGCEMVEKYLPAFGFDQASIQRICEIIMSTKIPQSATNQLERILCDADLDYLGRDDFEQIAGTLFDELQHYIRIDSEQNWNRIQLHFLSQHQYHTNYGRQFREAKKQEHLQKIRKIVEAYSEEEA